MPWKLRLFNTAVMSMLLSLLMTLWVTWINLGTCSITPYVACLIAALLGQGVLRSTGLALCKKCNAAIIVPQSNSKKARMSETYENHRLLRYKPLIYMSMPAGLRLECGGFHKSGAYAVVQQVPWDQLMVFLCVGCVLGL